MIINNLIIRTLENHYTIEEVSFIKKENEIDVNVLRVCGSEKGSRKNYIFKYFEKEPKTPRKSLFKNEMMNYQFLTSLKGFSWYPIVNKNDGNLLILEDLGESAIDEFVDEKEAQESLMETFVTMHIAAWGKEKQYANFLSDRKTNNIFFNVNLIKYQFYEGVQWYLRQIHFSGQNALQAKKEIATIEATIYNNETFNTFIHADYLSDRQSVVKNKRFYLLDFEWSYYGHALLDVTKLFVGKFELIKDTIFRNYFEPEKDIINYYKKRWETLSGHSITAQKWNHNLDSTIIFNFLILIGQYKIMSENEKLMKTHKFNESFTTILRKSSNIILELKSTNSEYKLFYKELLKYSSI